MQLSIVKARATAKSVKSVKVTVDDEAFAVQYNIEGLSLKDLKRLSAGGDNADLAAYLAGILVDWDLYDGDDKVAISADSLAAMPLALLRAISEAVFGDIQVSKS